MGEDHFAAGQHLLASIWTNGLDLASGSFDGEKCGAGVMWWKASAWMTLGW